MFSYILTVNAPADPQSDDMFRRFKETPGLLHAYDLEAVDSPNDMVVVTIWDNEESANAYLQKAPLRKEADAAYPGIKRTMYRVRDSK